MVDINVVTYVITIFFLYHYIIITIYHYIIVIITYYYCHRIGFSLYLCFLEFKFPVHYTCLHHVPYPPKKFTAGSFFKCCSPPLAVVMWWWKKLFLSYLTLNLASTFFLLFLTPHTGNSLKNIKAKKGQTRLESNGARN